MVGYAGFINGIILDFRRFGYENIIDLSLRGVACKGVFRIALFLARAIILDVCRGNECVLSDPEPLVRMTEHGTSSVNLIARVWVLNANYWSAYFDILEGVKRAFDKEGIVIPYNQIDVHLKNDRI